MGVYLGKIPVGVIVNLGKGSVIYCDVEQIIDGNSCELIITEGDVNSKYVLSYNDDLEYLSIYLNEK